MTRLLPLAIAAIRATAAVLKPFPTNTEMASFDLPCPDAQSVSFGASAPAGWFVSTDTAPTDPSITYQVMVATAAP